MSKKVMRFLIPADESEIVLPMTGALRFVTSTADGVIECYIEEIEGSTAVYTVIRVVENGKTMPDYYSYLGSVVIGRTVRHLYAAVPDDEPALGAQPWTPASTNDADVENVENLDRQNSFKYSVTDPEVSQ